MTERIPLRGALGQDPKYMTYGELHALRAHPENMQPIEARRRVLALRLAQRQVLRDVRTRLRADHRIAFDRPGGERVVVHADSLKHVGNRWVLLPAAEAVPLRIERHQPGLTSFVQHAPEVWLEFEEETSAQRQAIPVGTVVLHATNAIATDDRSAQDTGAQTDVIIPSLTLVVARDAPAEVKSVNVLLREAQSALDAGEVDMHDSIARAAGRLRARNASLQREVTSKQHERIAYGFASLLTVFMGAVAALRRRYALPLPVYLWSFVPALGAIITIGAGQGLAHESGLPGLAMLWGGLVGLAVFTWGEYTKLCRH